MFNLFSWVTDLVETFTFYGGGGKGGGSSSSSSQPVDFFGKGERAPYANLLAQLLGVGGGTMGGTQGYYTNGGNGYSDPNGGHWESRPNGFGLSNQVWVPNNKGGSNRGRSNQGTYVPGTPGMSLTDFIKSQPNYQFGINQGQDVLTRQFNSTGVGDTGAQQIALQGYGNQYAGNAYQQLISNLMGPSGSTLIGNSSTSQSQGASPIPGVLGTLAGAAMSAPAAGAGAALGSTAFWLGSDKNLKTNIKHINTINGIKIYSFNYIWSYIKSIGVMAQDLLEMPQYKYAVHMTSIGYMVDYSKLPI
jgi:hypothetical protein